MAFVPHDGTGGALLRAIDGSPFSRCGEEQIDSPAPQGTAALAQSVEHFTRNEKVKSSILLGGSIHPHQRLCDSHSRCFGLEPQVWTSGAFLRESCDGRPRGAPA